MIRIERASFNKKCTVSARKIEEEIKSSSVFQKSLRNGIVNIFISLAGTFGKN
jgi:hypothetical protein